MSFSLATLVNVLWSTLLASRVSAMRVRWSIWFTLPLLAGCGGNTALVHCNLSSDCALGQICIPSPVGATYCSASDKECPSGLRWAPSAGQGLAGQCVILTSDAGIASPGDAGVPSPPVFGACASQTDGVVCAPSNNPCKQPGVCIGGTCTPISNVADGTACGSGDACHSAPVCQGGECQPAAALPDGTTCGNAADVCQTAPTCKSGACQPGAARLDLSKEGTGDFSIDFTVTTKMKNLKAAILNQRDSCSLQVMWDVRMNTNGTLAVEVDDDSTSLVLNSLAAVNDGNPHAVVITRTAGTVTIQIDGVSSGSSSAATGNLTTLPTLQIGTDPCDGVDGTNALLGTVTNVCLLPYSTLHTH